VKSPKRLEARHNTSVSHFSTALRSSAHASGPLSWMDVDEAGTGDRVFIDDADEARRGNATHIVHGAEVERRAQSPDQAATSPATVVVGASPTVTLPLRDDSPLPVQQAAAQAPPGDERMIAVDWAHLTQSQRWLLYLRHANKCQAPEGHCPLLTDCHVVRNLLVHVRSRMDDKCSWRNCVFARHALGHYEVCRIEKCDHCAPVRAEMRRQHEKQQLQLAQRSAELTGDAVMDAGDDDGGDEESGSDEDSDEEAVEEDMDDEGEDGDEMEDEPREDEPGVGGIGDGDGVQAPMAATADVQHSFYSEEEDAALRDFAKRCGGFQSRHPGASPICTPSPAARATSTRRTSDTWICIRVVAC